MHTFPLRWSAPLLPSVLLSPVCAGPNVLVADGPTLHAFARSDGRLLWSVKRKGDILPVTAVDGGCITATSERDGMRIEKLDPAGRVVWELAGRWNVWPLGLVGAHDRFVLSGARCDASEDSRLWELSAADGVVIRSVRGASRPGIIRIEGGWAWVDNSEAEPRVRILDADGDRVVFTGDVKALAWTDGLLLADGAGRLRAFGRDGLVWERPGGTTRVLAADPRGIACGRRDGDGLWICNYALDGTPRGEAGPFPDGYPTLVYWENLLIASGVYLGDQDAVVILDRADRRMVHVESGGWEGAHGSVTVDGDAAFVLCGDNMARRDRCTWERSEDAWSAEYAIEVAAQLVRDDDGLLGELPQELAAVQGGGATSASVSSDLARLRDAIAVARAAGRRTYDRFSDALPWMSSASDWPLCAIGLAEDHPNRRVELMRFDQEVDGPEWDQRERIATYAQLRLLSMRTNALLGPLGVDLGALPMLEYLSLAENLLVTVPPEIRRARSLIHVNLCDNRLTSIEASELPPSLRWLDVSRNRLSEETIERLRVALPACHIESYGQRP